jgi:hypothetical protein
LCCCALAPSAHSKLVAARNMVRVMIRSRLEIRF